MSFNIEFDYRFAPQDVFTDAVKFRLEQAAQIWEYFITDEFDNIPVGTAFEVSFMGDSQTHTIVLNQEIDDLLIFVSAVSNIGAAGYGGPELINSIYQERYAGSDFEPAVGSITFEATDATIAELGTALHEIGHVLGISTAEIFDIIGTGQLFDGANTLAVTQGQPVPLTANGHVREDFTWQGLNALMHPGGGNADLPTMVDLAMLADIGYQIPAIANPSTAVNYTLTGTSDTEQFKGLNGNDVISVGGGDDYVLGNGGNDTLNGEDGDDMLEGGTGNDRLNGGTGDDFLFAGDGDDVLDGGVGKDQLLGGAGNNTFLFNAAGGQDYIFGFNPIQDKVQLAASWGFTNRQAIVDALEVYNNISYTYEFNDISITSTVLSKLTLSPGNELLIYHNGQLTRNNFFIEGNIDIPDDDEDKSDRLVGTDQADILLGTSASNTILGGSGNDRLSGKDGNDVIKGQGGNDSLDGGRGRDRLFGGNGNDGLKGGAGKDTLEGDKGTNKLIGGTERDVFVLARGGVAVIKDFEDGVDRIGFGRLDEVYIVRRGEDTLLTGTNNTIVARLENIDSRFITQADFV